MSVDDQAAQANSTVKPTICSVNILASTPRLATESNLGTTCGFTIRRLACQDQNPRGRARCTQSHEHPYPDREQARAAILICKAKPKKN